MLHWIEAANREPTLIERIRALLRADNWISFAELDRLDGFRGDGSLLADQHGGNLVLWPSISEEAAAALTLMIAAGECHMIPASIFSYLADGKIPTLPIAKRRVVYKRPHWLPVALARGPAAAEAMPRRAGRARQPKPAPRKRHLVPGKLRARR